MKSQIIFSHPAKQGTMYHRALAAQEAGLGITFLTGMYFGDTILAKSMQSRIVPRFLCGLMRRRNQPGLASSNVRILPDSVMAECFFRPLGRVREWDTVHDFSASHWLLREVVMSILALKRTLSGSWNTPITYSVSRNSHMIG
jgi:hypothetical protein